MVPAFSPVSEYDVLGSGSASCPHQRNLAVWVQVKPVIQTSFPVLSTRPGKLMRSVLSNLMRSGKFQDHKQEVQDLLIKLNLCLSLKARAEKQAAVAYVKPGSPVVSRTTPTG